MNSFCVGSIFCKLNCDFSAINFSSVQPIYCLLCFICILVTNERKTTGFTSPSIFGDENINNLSVLIKKREQIVGRRPETNVKNEEIVGV